MNIFALNIILLAFWGIVFRKSLSKETARVPGFIIVATLQLALIALFSPLVSDTLVYAHHAAINWYSFEPGWNLLSSFLWRIWPDGRCLMLFVNYAFLFSFARFVWKRSYNFFISYLTVICLGIWGMSFFILRQSLALAVLLFAYDALEDGKSIKLMVLVLLAASFHATALAFLVLYPLIRLRRDALYLVMFLFVGFAFFLFGSDLINFILLFSRNEYGTTDFSGLGLLSMLVVFELLIAFFLTRGSNKMLICSFDVGCILQILALRFSVFTRVTRYFTVSLCVLLPAMLASIDDKKSRQLVSWLMCGALLVLYFVFDGCSFPGGPDAYIVTSPF